jgi:hypothetical protein
LGVNPRRLDKTPTQLVHPERTSLYYKKAQEKLNKPKGKGDNSRPVKLINSKGNKLKNKRNKQKA